MCNTNIKLTFKGGVHTDAKEKKTENLRSEHRRQVRYEGMIGLPRPETWSAQMPAYCYTVLCPVSELQESRTSRLYREEQDG